MSERTGFSLKAACSHCGLYGTVDEGSLICSRCGGVHELTEVEDRQRGRDRAIYAWAMYERRRGWRRWFR